jgi:hypothetical protein
VFIDEEVKHQLAAGSTASLRLALLPNAPKQQRQKLAAGGEGGGGRTTGGSFSTGLLVPPPLGWLSVSMRLQHTDMDIGKSDIYKSCRLELTAGETAVHIVTTGLHEH